VNSGYVLCTANKVRVSAVCSVIHLILLLLFTSDILFSYLYNFEFIVCGTLTIPVEEFKKCRHYIFCPEHFLMLIPAFRHEIFTEVNM
jgi:hypothetical protein